MSDALIGMAIGWVLVLVGILVRQQYQEWQEYREIKRWSKR